MAVYQSGKGVYGMEFKRLCQTRRNPSRVLIFMAAIFTLAIQASASTTSGGLPWEAPMTAIATSLTGPVAYAIGLIGIAIAGGTMLWGGDLGEVGRKACMIGLVIAVLVFAAPMLNSAFGVAAALV
jgi:type IV secretion system protein VirB2